MTFEPCRKTSFCVLSSSFWLFSAALAAINFDDGCYCSFSVAIDGYLLRFTVLCRDKLLLFKKVTNLTPWPSERLYRSNFLIFWLLTFLKQWASLQLFKRKPSFQASSLPFCCVLEKTWLSLLSKATSLLIVSFFNRPHSF